MRSRLMKALATLVARGEPGLARRALGSWMLRKFPGMLSCRELEEFVHDYYEGGLSARDRRRFETHLQLCPMCRVHFDAYVKSVALGQRVCEDEDRLPEGMPEELVGAILAARESGPER